MSDLVTGKRVRSVAESYDAHAFAQRLAARDLLATLSDARPRTILEPGCGTGIYTRMLADAFPGAAIDAIDIDSLALDAAKLAVPSPAVRFAVADAEGPLSGTYDAVTSNAVFQWFRDLPGTLARLTAVLIRGGTLSFSCFGPRTYAELEDSLTDALGSGAHVAAAGFADGAVIRAALALCCRNSSVEETRYEQVFPSLRALLDSIRCTGVARSRSGAGLWTPRVLERVERSYLSRYRPHRGDVPGFHLQGREMRGLFVTGTDTGVGKTLVTGYLAAYLSELGWRVVTQKWVETGCDGESADIRMHDAIAGRESGAASDAQALRCPYLFRLPASPHLAAAQEGRSIDAMVIEAAYRDPCTAVRHGNRRRGRGGYGAFDRGASYHRPRGKARSGRACRSA